MDDLVNDDGAFPASENTPGQKESRTAYKRFLANSGLEKDEKTRAELAVQDVWGNSEPVEWLEMWLQLRAEGWDWRKAALIAWSACPTDKRWPKTVSELAVNVLGLKSDRTVRQWREKDPKIEERISKLLIWEFMDARAGTIRQSIHVAQTEGGPGFNDRQMILKVTKMLKDQMELSGKDGKPIEQKIVNGFEDLSSAELDGIIANLQAAERATGSSAG